jgi:hypothetical protein
MTCEREVGRNTERCSLDTRGRTGPETGIEMYTVVTQSGKGACDA